jgi:hypothetical protein
MHRKGLGHRLHSTTGPYHRMHEDLGRLMLLCLENEGGSTLLRRSS